MRNSTLLYGRVLWGLPLAQNLNQNLQLESLTNISKL